MRESIADGLETALKLVSKLSGPVGSVTNTLKTVIEQLKERTEDIAEAADGAQHPDSAYTRIINLISFEKGVLTAELVVIDAILQELGSVEAGLADTVAFVEFQDEFDVPVEFLPAIKAANDAVVGINQGYAPIIEIIDRLQAARHDIAAAQDGILAPGRAILERVAFIRSHEIPSNLLISNVGELKTAYHSSATCSRRLERCKIDYRQSRLSQRTVGRVAGRAEACRVGA